MDYDELVQELRKGGCGEYCDKLESDAADAITTLQARVAELERLLTHTGLLAAQEECNCIRSERDGLRKELAAARSDLLGARTDRQHATEALADYRVAFAQERERAERAEAELAAARAALQQIAAIENQQYGHDLDEIDQAREIANAVLTAAPGSET